MNTRVISIAILASSFVLVSVEARAAMCDSLVLDDDPQDVLIGTVGNRICLPSVGCVFFPSNPGTMAACWRDEGGAWQFEQLTCDVNTSASDYLLVTTNGGDDRVSFLRTEHFPTAPYSFSCAGHWMGPALPAFAFYTNAYLGGGEDLYHGSEGRDFVYTNVPQFSFTGPFMLADDATDKVCANEGNDSLMGDLDDDWATFEDYLDGGPGSDSCDGDAYANGDDDSDLYRSCETHSDAFDDTLFGTPGIIDCAADDDPFHEW